MRQSENQQYWRRWVTRKRGNHKMLVKNVSKVSQSEDDYKVADIKIDKCKAEQNLFGKAHFYFQRLLKAFIGKVTENGTRTT